MATRGRPRDPESNSYKFNEALFGDYIPEKQMTVEQSQLYHKAMGRLLNERQQSKQKMISELSKAGILSPKLRSYLTRFTLNHATPVL